MTQGTFFKRPSPVTLADLAVLTGALFADFKTFSAVLRERKDLMTSYQPGATIGALARYAKQQMAADAAAVVPVAVEAVPLVAVEDAPVVEVDPSAAADRAAAVAARVFAAAETVRPAARA